MNFVTTFTAILLATTVIASAADLTILNTGSETGSWASITTALSTDLASTYTIAFQNPGKHCVAVAANMPTITGPVLFPWGNDLEAAGRDGEGCATVDVKPSAIIGFTASPLYACSMNNLDILKTDGKVGHTTPPYAFTRLITAINTNFGTNHVGVPYDGSGDARAALLSGEVEYIVVSERHAEKVKAEGATCAVSTSANGPDNFASLAADKDLVVEFTTVLATANMTEGQQADIKKSVEAAYADTGSAFYGFTGGIDYQWDGDLAASYESSVVAMQKN